MNKNFDIISIINDKNSKLAEIYDVSILENKFSKYLDNEDKHLCFLCVLSWT